MATALVTGASAGIGRAFAEALAARGDDLVLVARDTARLDQLAAELKARHGIAVEVLTADLTAEKGVGAVEGRLTHPDAPDLLVNNAGIGTFGKFAELPIDAELREIQLNVVALVRLSRAALPGMIERKRGGIINISSLACYQPTPTNATYGATKAFVTSFTQALHEELRGTGVVATAVCPGFTRTEFQERAEIDSSGVPSWAWQSAEAVVGAALRDHGRGRALSVPGALNKVGAAFTSALPAGITRRLAGTMLPRLE